MVTVLIYKRDTHAICNKLTMADEGGYDSDIILSQGLDLFEEYTEEQEKNNTFITQNTFLDGHLRKSLKYTRFCIRLSMLRICWTMAVLLRWEQITLEEGKVLT